MCFVTCQVLCKVRYYYFSHNRSRGEGSQSEAVHMSADRSAALRTPAGKRGRRVVMGAEAATLLARLTRKLQQDSLDKEEACRK